MLNFSIPEILRVSLNNVCLSVKAARENEDVQVFTCVLLLESLLTPTLGIHRESD